MSNEFYIGQQIVCVDDKWFYWRWKETGPIRGNIYTVRKIAHGGIQLKEIVNPPYQYDDAYGECAFKFSRFRPLVKTDISIFTEMLNHSPSRVNA